jgi:sulfate adenylyltransferase subunit 1
MVAAAPSTADGRRQLLRFATIGSVDDGKSTLIGRLLHDAKGLFDDQLDAVSRASAGRGREGLDLSLVTDGLRAEREQGITIDVAYRYAATPRRSFIVADNPGHTQYTRNMATGASTADVAVVLVDVRSGLLEQTRRHLAVASLIGIRQVVLAVNKMDLVDWAPAPFRDVTTTVAAYLARLGIVDVVAIPISALLGDNVVERSSRAEWYDGPTLLDHLETVDVLDGDAGRSSLRVPVQLVLRAEEHGRPARRYAGIVTGARVEVGDPVVVLPQGTHSMVAGIEVGGVPVESASPGRSVALRLADDVDVIRGDVIAGAVDPPMAVREAETTVFWFAGRPLSTGDRCVIKLATRTERAVVRRVDGRLDLASLDLEPAGSLEANEIGRVLLAAAGPLVVDPYRVNRFTGSLLLIDPATNATVGAGTIS